MKLKNTFTGIALSLCVAMSSIAFPFQAQANESVTASAVLAEAQSTAQYIQSLWGDEDASVFSYRELILMLDSGIDCSTQYNNYCKTLSSYITEDGKLVIGGLEIPAMYAAAISVLTLGKDNPTDYNGANLVQQLSDCLSEYKTAEEMNEAIGNVYYYSNVLPTVNCYPNYFDDSVKTLLKDAMMLNYNSDDTGCGINYYGYSADNNGKVLPAAKYYCENDDELTQKINDATTWTKTLAMEDGGYKYDNNSWSTASNADSTGLALALLSSYGNADDTLNAYNALLTFKSTTTEGCYTYDGYDSSYAAVDALEGLLSYYNYLVDLNITTPFDISIKRVPVVTYSLTYNANNGKIGNSSKKTITIATDTAFGNLEKISPVRAGYTFDGWYTAKKNGSKLTSKASFEKDTVIYAHWTKVTVGKASITKLKSSNAKKAVITFSKVSCAKKYQIVYADNKNFKKAAKVSTTAKTYTFNKLKSKKTYYFKVRAIKSDSTGKNIYGAYSNVKKVTIK